VNTPNPAPDERANGWRTEYPHPAADWDTPDSAQAPQESPAQSPGSPIVSLSGSNMRPASPNALSAP